MEVTTWATLVLCSCVLAAAAVAGEQEAKPFFEVQDIFQGARIPAIVVAADGSVLAFARSGRVVRRSTDGGKTWAEAREVGPEATGGRDVLLYSAPDNPGRSRIRMTVWASFDGARTWPVKRLVHEGPSAYSSLAAGKDGTAYLLFEREAQKLYESIAVARFNLAWLTDGQDWRKFLKD